MTIYASIFILFIFLVFLTTESLKPVGNAYWPHGERFHYSGVDPVML